MKVLLVRPHAPNKLSFTGILDNEPLELEYLHTVLQENGYQDYIFDAFVEQVPFSKVLKRENPDVVAITGYITQENIMKKMARAAKSHNQNITTIVGGVHAQLNYQRYYDDGIDYIFRSESLSCFIDLIRHIDQGNGPLNAINGLCYKENGEFVTNELVAPDINALPIPDRSHFYKYQDSYRYLDLTPIATIKTSLSCPYDCSFCYCTLLSKGKYRVRNLDLVLDEIEGIACENIQIVDDDFLVDRDRILTFVQEIKRRGIDKQFICYARADFVAENPDIVEMLAQIGFVYFLVGLEAISDEILISYNKNTSQDTNRKCVAAIQSTTANCIGLFIMGIGATRKDFTNLVRWVEVTGIKHVTVSIFTPIPGTKLYEQNKKLITSNRIEDWDFLHLVMDPTNLSRFEFYLEYYKMFMKLLRIAKKTGVYDFMDINYYRKLLRNYLIQRMVGL